MTVDEKITAELLHQLDGGTYQTGVPQRALLAIVEQLCAPGACNAQCCDDVRRIITRALGIVTHE